MKLYREDPLRVQERAAAGEVAAPLEVGLPGPGAGHSLVPAHDPDQALELPTKFVKVFTIFGAHYLEALPMWSGWMY